MFGNLDLKTQQSETRFDAQFEAQTEILADEVQIQVQDQNEVFEIDRQHSDDESNPSTPEGETWLVVKHFDQPDGRYDGFET